MHFFTALNSNNNVAVARVMGEQSDNGNVDGTVSKNRELGNANDCAYYDSGYFIAQGGSGNHLSRGSSYERLSQGIYYAQSKLYKLANVYDGEEKDKLYRVSFS